MKINSTKKYKVVDCFKGKNIYYRDSDLDIWLPKEMPKVEAGDTRMFITKQDQTFKQMFKEFTGSEKIKDEHIFSLSQIEQMLKEPEKYELLTDGYANFFPISSEHMLYARRRDDGRWNADARRLGYSNEWSAGDRLLLRNFFSAPKTLGNLELDSAIKLVKEAGLKVYKEI